MSAYAERKIAGGRVGVTSEPARHEHAVAHVAHDRAESSLPGSDDHVRSFAGRWSSLDFSPVVRVDVQALQRTLGNDRQLSRADPFAIEQTRARAARHERIIDHFESLAEHSTARMLAPKGPLLTECRRRR